MEILLHIETHIYSEDQLRDEQFNDPQNFGIYAPEDFNALIQYHDYWMQMEYDQSTTLGDVAKTVINTIIKDIENPHDCCVDYFAIYLNRFYFLSSGIRYSISNYDANLKTALSKYLDPNGTGIISVSILASSDAGEVWSEDNLRFDMRSREGNRHKKPHVHVYDKHAHQEASICILDLSVLAGELSSKAEKKAKEIIKDKQVFFIECWNTKTDGLYVDIDKCLGLIQY